jgi:hypothetical protein
LIHPEVLGAYFVAAVAVITDVGISLIVG